MKKFNTILILFCVIILTSFTSAENQPLPTSLRITILNELGNIEAGVKVTLYKTDEDYKSEENPVSESQLTDKKGRVTFKNLAPIVYFVNAEKGDKNNYGAGVQTDTIQEGRINKVSIIIE